MSISADDSDDGDEHESIYIDEEDEKEKDEDFFEISFFKNCYFLKKFILF